MTPEQYAEANERLKRPDFPEHLRAKLEAKMAEYVQEKLVVKPPARQKEPTGIHETPKQNRFDELDAIQGQGEVDPALVGITASGRKAFSDSPPEYSPGGTFDAFRTKYVLEPTVQHFRDEMRGTLGDRVDVLGENSVEYQEYADRLWQKELQKAKAEGRPVARQKFISGPKRLLAEAGGAATSFGLGAADIGSAGILTGGGGRLAEAAGDESLSRSSQERVREEYPISSALGGVFGALSPTSVPSLAAKGLTKLGASVAPSVATSTAGRIASAGLTGATVAGGESAVRDVAYGNTDDPSLVAKRAALYAALGGPLAMGGAAIGEAAGRSAVASADRPGMRDVIYPADEAGIGFGPFMGVRPPPVAKRLTNQAIEAGHAADVEGYAISKLEKPFAEAGRKLQEAELRPPARRLELSQKLQRNSRFEPSNTGNAMLEILEGNVQASGKPEPFVRNLSAVRKEIASVFDYSPARTKEVADRMMRSRPNGKVYTREEAERLGLGDLFGTAKEAQFLVLSPSAKSIEKMDEMIRRIDDLANADRIARGGDSTDPMFERLMAEARKDRDLIPALPKNLPVEVDSKALDAEYELGDGRRVKGYSALMTDYERTLERAQKRSLDAGLPGEVPKPAPRPVRGPGLPEFDPLGVMKNLPPAGISPSDATKVASPRPNIPGKGAFRGDPIGEPVPKLSEAAGQWDKLRAKLLDYGRTGGSPASRQAIREIADSAGLTKELGALRAVGLEKAADQLGSRGGLGAFVSGSGNVSGSVNANLLNHLSYRSLPLRAALAGDEGYGGNLLTDIASKVSPGLKSLLRKMRGQGMPEAEARGRFGDSAMYRAKSPNLSRFALRGGRTGATALATDVPDAEEDQELTPEDLKNLKLLIEATQ